jgi:D-aminopeptidase
MAMPAKDYAPKRRARDLGLPLPGVPGECNAITDVPGVEVGYATIKSLARRPGERQIYTGVTAVLPRGHSRRPSAVWAGQHDLNGNGEMTGTHWIEDAGYFIGPICLTNTHAVGIVHHAAVAWMIEQYSEHFHNHHAWAMPVVAETYDGVVSDICGRHVEERHAREALLSARGGPVAEGNVGGGAGNQTYQFKGGTGTSSRQIQIGSDRFTVGVLVQSNFGTRRDFTVLGVPVGTYLTDDIIELAPGALEQGSIIVIIATDAPLSPTQLRRLAKRGALGIGRTGTSGGHYSGDLMLAFSVANETYLPAIGEPQPYYFRAEWLNDAYLDEVYRAAVEATEESVLNALLAAESVPTAKPSGQVLKAIDHDALMAVLRQHRLPAREPIGPTA